MIERGLYFASKDFSAMIRSVGGTWNDVKERPIVCLIKSIENDKLYWAIPMGKYDHRDEKQKERLQQFLKYPERDIRSCYYHVGRTTTQSIFFVSDAIPITADYIEREYQGYDSMHYVIQNPKLIQELERKLFRILAMENSKPNCYRQHITDVKHHLLNQLSTNEEHSIRHEKRI